MPAHFCHLIFQLQVVCMVTQVAEFSSGGTKLEKNLPNNQHTQRKLLILGIGVVGRCQKVPKFDNFYVKNHPKLSQFFSLKSINLGAHFLFFYTF